MFGREGAGKEIIFFVILRKIRATKRTTDASCFLFCFFCRAIFWQGSLSTKIPRILIPDSGAGEKNLETDNCGKKPGIGTEPERIMYAFVNRTTLQPG